MAKDIRVATTKNGKITFFAVCTVTQQPYSVKVDHSAWRKWQEGSKIQDALPELSPQQREFLLSGMTPAEWEAVLGKET